MSDTIGRITVPTVINSRQTFPLTTQYLFGCSSAFPSWLSWRASSSVAES
jgi:hypothetical protein